jgi:assimilatory nitrate reductase catalytic subunit
MGFARAFAYRSAADVFREHAALSAFRKRWRACLRFRRARHDLGRGLRRARAGAVAVHAGCDAARLFADGHFPTDDGKARFIAPRAAGIARADRHRIPVSASTPGGCAINGTA